MGFDHLRFAFVDGLATITLCRPERANAINLALARELLMVAESCKAAHGLRAVLIENEGDMFCAGGDVAAFASAEDMPDLLGKLMDQVHRAIGIFRQLDAPVIAAVDGTAAGGGLGLIASCSLVYATERSRFASAYTRIGLTPDAGTSWFLPRLIGWRRTEELMLTNRVLTAREAKDWGLITEYAADGSALRQAVQKVVAQLVKGPTKAYATARQLLEASLTTTLSDHLALEAIAMKRSGSTRDGTEGVRAFLAKRAPAFHGS